MATDIFLHVVEKLNDPTKIIGFPFILREKKKEIAERTNGQTL